MCEFGPFVPSTFAGVFRPSAARFVTPFCQSGQSSLLSVSLHFSGSGRAEQCVGCELGLVALRCFLVGLIAAATGALALNLKQADQITGILSAVGFELPGTALNATLPTLVRLLERLPSKFCTLTKGFSQKLALIFV